MQLICAAWNEELRHCEPHSGEAIPMLAPLGIGYLEAALELTRILNQHSDIDEILFLGTCGSYNLALKIGDLVSVSSVALLGRGEILGLAYAVREGVSYESGDCFVAVPAPRNDDTLLSLRAKRSNPLAVPCLCSLEITNSSELSTRILEHYGFERAVENMELYGVARVASERGIKWSARLGVTNYTNIEAHQDWLKNHQALSKKLGAVLLQV